MTDCVMHIINKKRLKHVQRFGNLIRDASKVISFTLNAHTVCCRAWTLSSRIVTHKFWKGKFYLTPISTPLLTDNSISFIFHHKIPLNLPLLIKAAFSSANLDIWLKKEMKVRIFNIPPNSFNILQQPK